jgi:hypothetical protein
MSAKTETYQTCPAVEETQNRTRRAVRVRRREGSAGHLAQYQLG